MSKHFFIIFILIAGFFYLQAAFEVNTDDIKNTWDDEYDTYIHSDNSSNNHFYKVDHGKDLPAIVPSSFGIPISESEIIISFTERLNSPPPKLFLAFRSLLI